MKKLFIILIMTVLIMPLLTHAQVGVGSLTPTSMLHVADTVTGTSSWQGSFMDIQNVSSVLNTSAGIRFKVDDNVNNHKYRAGIFFKRNTVNANGSLIFSNTESTTTGNVTSTTNARMTITAAGLVGIGTTSPDHKLSIVSSNATTDGSSGVFMDIQNSYTSNGVISGIRFRNGTTDETFKGGIFYQDKLGFGRGDLIFVNNSVSSSGNVTLDDTRMTIKNNGNIGIGTTDPEEIFHVYDPDGGLDVKFESDNGNPKIYMDGTTGSSGIFFENSGIAKANMGYNLATDNLYFTHGQTIAMKNGFLGIGALAPQYPIHVKAIGVDCEVLFESTSGRSLLRMDGQAGLGEIRFQTDGTYKGAFGYNYDNDNLFLYHGGNMVFKNGKLGVGETNPVYQLHVLGDAKIESNDGGPKLKIDGTFGQEGIDFELNGVVKASIGYDISQEHLYLTEDQNVYIQDGNTYIDGHYKYNGSRTFVKQFPAAAFTLTNSKEPDKVVWSSDGGIYNDDADDFYFRLQAPVNLPDGAIITKFGIYLYNSDPSLCFEVRAQLKKRLINDPSSILMEEYHNCIFNTSGSVKSYTLSTIIQPIVDNENAQYFINLIHECGESSEMQLYGAKIEYTLNQLNP